MRYIPISQVEPGMALGQDIYDGAGRMLLASHLILNREYIASLSALGFPGVYIDDAFSEDIEIVEVIRPEVKREALSLINSMFIDDPQVGLDLKMKHVAEEVVESVLLNGYVMCNMMDIKSYDDYTYYHSVNVGILAAMVGSTFDLNVQQLADLTMAAMLHDVGKRFIPLEILNKEDHLSDEERAVLQTHPRQGADFLRDHYKNFSVYVLQGVLQHHEWYDGEGYPLGRMSDDIPLEARIISVVDVYDALTSNRPYREAHSNAEALEYIMGSSGRQFDPEVIDHFMHKIAIYPVGVQVELSDGSSAVVMENYEEFVLRPKVKQIGTGRVMDLARDPELRNITITRLIMG